MAKKKTLKTDDDFNWDDDLDLPGFNFDEKEVPDNRKPITKIKDSIKSGAKQSLANPGTYAKIVRNALPKEYGEIYDSADRVGQNIKNVYKDAAKEVKPALSEVAKTANSFVPEEMSKLKGYLKKVEDWGADDKPSLKQDLEKQRNDNVTLELGKIFKSQAIEQSKDRAQQASQKRIDDTLGVIRHRDQMTLLNQLSLDMQRLSQYQTTVTRAYQQKSLELQYRSYYVQADMLELQRKTTLALSSRLDVIANNTALPEFVKLNKFEALKEQFRNNFAQSVTKGIFGDTNARVEKFFSNMSQKIRAGASQAGSTLMRAASDADMLNSMDFGQDKRSLMEILTTEGTAAAMDYLAGKTGTKLRRASEKHLPKFTQKVDGLAQDINYYKENGLSMVENFSRRGYDNSKGPLANMVMSLFKDAIRGNLESGTGNNSLITKGLNDIRGAETFNNQTQKSITEVIPGLLSRILREVQITRTGDENTDLTEYDYTKNKFSTKNDIKETIKNSLFDGKRSGYIKTEFDYFLKSNKIDDNFSEKQKLVLARAMLANRKDDGVFDKDFFTNSDNFKDLRDSERDHLTSAFDKYYSAGDVEDSGRELEIKKRRAKMASWSQNFSDDFRDPSFKIQQHVNAGQMEHLKELGIVNENDRINTDKLLDIAINGMRKDEIHSDMFLKENIKNFDPKKILNKITQVPMKLWNYKDGNKASDNKKKHLGPMAQDMKSIFGDEMAPGGKSIDLGSMISATMAGVQGVNEKVKTLGGALKSQIDILTSILASRRKNSGVQNPSDLVEPFMEGELPGPESNTTVKEPGNKKQSTLKNIEELLAIIAANTSHTGYGIDFTERFIKDGKQQKFKFKFPELFKARRKTERNAAEQERRQRSSSKLRNPFSGPGLLGSGSDFVTAGLNFGLDIFDNVKQGGINAFRYLLPKAKNVNSKYVQPGKEKATTFSKQAFTSVSDYIKGQADIYVDGERQPRILKSKLLEGKYFDVNTGKIIQRIKDITGPIKDITDGSIVVNQDEIDKLVIRPFIIGKTLRIGKELLKTGWNKLSAIGNNLWNTQLPIGWGAALKFGKKLANMGLNIVDHPRDVYVKGEDKPRLYKTGFENSGYFLRNKQTVVRRPGQITDEIIDRDGNVLISNEDISKGLVDAKGVPIQTTLKRVASIVAGTARQGLRKVKGLFKHGKKLFDSGKKLFNAGKDSLTNFAKDGWQSITKMFEGFSFGFGDEKIYKVLESIRDILDSRLPRSKKRVLGDNDGNGTRDGSWQDLVGKDRENKNNHAPGEVAKAGTYRTGNIFNKIEEMVTGLLGKIVDGALGLLGLGGLFGGKGKAAAATAGAAAKSGRLASIVSKIKDLGAVGGIGGILAAAASGGKNLVGKGLSALGGLAGLAPTMATTVPAAAGAAASKGGLLTALGRVGGSIMRSGVNGAASILGGAAKAAPVVANGAIAAGKLGASVAGSAIKGGLTLGSGLGSIGRLGLKALPGLGVGIGLYSAAEDAMAGNYGSAAMNLGLASISGLGVGGTLAALGTAGGAVLSAIFSPVGLAALGTAAAVYGIYKAYKWISNKTFSKLSLMRMFQYGIGDADKEYRMKIYNLEKMLQPYVEINGTQAFIKEGKLDPKEVLKIFGIKEDDKESALRFGEWFQNRFKPVFLSYMAALNRIKGKSNIDLVDEIKEPKEQLDLITQTAQPTSVYDSLALPFPESPKSVVTASLMQSIINDARKALITKVGSDLDPKKQKKGFFGSLFGSDMPDSKDQTTDIKQDKDASTTSKKISNLMRTDAAKLGSGGVSVGSEQVGDWFNNKNIDAFDAVRYKAYGLTTFEEGLVASLKWLESVVNSDMRRQANGTTVWTGDPASVLDKARRYFGFSFNDKKQDERWLNWFLNRFLPIYTTKVNGVAHALGNDNYKDQAKTFKIDTPVALKIAEQIMSMSKPWLVSTSPWLDVKLGTDPEIAKVNIEYLRKLIKQRELEQDQVKNEKAKTGASDNSGASSEVSKDNDDYNKWLADSQQKANKRAETLREYRKKADAEAASKGLITGGAQQAAAAAGADTGGSRAEPVVESVDVEPPQQSTAPAPVKKDDSKGSGTGGGNSASQAAPALASGELNAGNGGDKFIKAGQKKLAGTHPAFLKLLMGAIQEYGEKTGRQISINEGFRSYAYQAALKKKLGAKAASPGNSMHEFGLAVDIDSADLDAMEKLGLMRKYGLTRPVGAEPWHVEPAGVQTNIAGFKKDPNGAGTAIEAGVGKGGGGYGTVTGATKYGRSPELAKQLLNAQSKPGEGVKDDKKPEDTKDGATSKLATPNVGMTRRNDGTNVMPTGKPSETSGGFGDGSVVTGSGGAPTATVPSEGESKPSGGGKTSTAPNTSKDLGTPGVGANLSMVVPASKDAYSSAPNSTGNGWKSNKDLIMHAAKVTGVDPGMLASVIAVESGFKADAKAKSSSAKGLGQFVNRTWNEMMKKYGAQYGIPPGTPSTDPKANAIMTALYTKENHRALSGTKKDIKATDLYMAHFLGASGAKTFFSLGDQDTPASTMPDAAKANPDIFYSKGRPRTKAEIYQILGGRVNNATKNHNVDIGGPFENEMVTQADGVNIIPSTKERNEKRKSGITGSISMPNRDPNVLAGSKLISKDGKNTPPAESNSAPGVRTSDGRTFAPEAPSRAYGVVDPWERPAPRRDDSVNTAYGVKPVVTAPVLQPQIRETEQELNKSVQSVERVLTDSLGVQRSILSVLQSMAVSKSTPQQPAATVDPNTGNKVNNFAPERFTRPVGTDPVSMRNITMT